MLTRVELAKWLESTEMIESLTGVRADVTILFQHVIPSTKSELLWASPLLFLNSRLILRSILLVSVVLLLGLLQCSYFYSNIPTLSSCF